MPVEGIARALRQSPAYSPAQTIEDCHQFDHNTSCVTSQGWEGHAQNRPKFGDRGAVLRSLDALIWVTDCGDCLESLHPYRSPNTPAPDPMCAAPLQRLVWPVAFERSSASLRAPLRSRSNTTTHCSPSIVNVAIAATNCRSSRSQTATSQSIVSRFNT